MLKVEKKSGLNSFVPSFLVPFFFSFFPFFPFFQATIQPAKTGSPD